MMQFFFLSIFNPLLVESADAEPTDMEAQLYIKYDIFKQEDTWNKFMYGWLMEVWPELLGA